MSIIFYIRLVVAVLRVSPSRYTRRSGRRFSLSVSVLILHPRPRARTSITARNAIIRGLEGIGGLGSRRKILERSCVREHSDLSPSFSSLLLFLSCLLRAWYRARGRTIDTVIYCSCAMQRSRVIYIKRRIYRIGGLIIFTSPANDSSGNCEPLSETRVRGFSISRVVRQRCSESSSCTHPVYSYVRKSPRLTYVRPL